MTDKEENLEDAIKGVDLSEKTELGEVTKEFGENKPSSSNLTSDEHKLTWRAKGIYSKYPKTLKLISDYIDSKRSVKGWNTEKKVEAIVGVKQDRGGNNMLTKLFSPKQGA